MPHTRLRFLKRAVAGGAGTTFVFAEEARANPMNITISIPGDGSSLHGTVDVTVAAQPAKNLQRIDLFVDGNKSSSSQASPLVYHWDTTQNADGGHMLRADAVYKQRVSTASIQVIVKNAAVPLPPNVAVSAPTAKVVA